MPIRPSKRPHSQDKEHQEAERRFWRIQTYIGVGAIFISVVALIGALIGLRLAQLAFHESGRQARAAEGQIRIAKDTEEKQLRAYVNLFEASAAVDANNLLRAAVIIKNFGQTPAYNATHWACSGIRDFPTGGQIGGEPDDLRHYPEEEALTAPVIINPGGIENYGHIFFCDDPIPEDHTLAADEKAGLVSGTKVVYIYGRTDYTDIFGDKRYTNYRVMTNYPFGMGQGQTRHSRKGNEAN